MNRIFEELDTWEAVEPGMKSAFAALFDLNSRLENAEALIKSLIKETKNQHLLEQRSPKAGSKELSALDDDWAIGDMTDHGEVTDVNKHSVCTGKNHLGVELWWKKSSLTKSKDEQPVKDEGEYYQWPLNGYAPGRYYCHCFKCKRQFTGDKRAVTCKECAIQMYKDWMADPRPEEEKLQESAETINQFFSGTGKQPQPSAQTKTVTQPPYDGSYWNKHPYGEPSGKLKTEGKAKLSITTEAEFVRELHRVCHKHAGIEVDLQEEIADLKEQLDDMNQKLFRRISEINGLDAQLERAVKERDIYNERTDELREQLTREQGHSDGYLKRLTEAEKEIERLRCQINEKL